MTKLLCPECRHENEPERVYCHNCGARLNRTGGVPGKSDGATTAETQKRLRRMMDPRGFRARQLLFNVVKLILGSCVAAALIQMLLPPDLPVESKTLDLGSQIGLDLEKAITEHHGAQLRYTQDQVNSYLTTVLKRKKTTLLDKPFLEFQRGVAALEEGALRFTAERSFLGYPLYTTASYSVSLQNGKIAAPSRGGSIGRMPIHPQLMQFTDVLLADVWKALELDRKQIAKLAAIELHPQTVVLTAPAQ
jgi:hypothetical protein